MPRKVETWGCDFKCGRHNMSRKDIEKHERTCAKNPARRACKTCRFDIKDHGDAEDPGIFNYCEIDVKPEGVQMTVDCEHWEGKDGTR